MAKGFYDLEARLTKHQDAYAAAMSNVQARLDEHQEAIGDNKVATGDVALQTTIKLKEAAAAGAALKESAAKFE